MTDLDNPAGGRHRGDTDPAGPPPVDLPRPDAAHLAYVHSEMWATLAGELADRFTSIAPDPGPHQLTNATTALRLATAAANAARDQATPCPDVDQLPHPADVAAAAAELSALAEAVEQLVDRLQKQVSTLHRAALDGRVDAPPGATAHAEVERVLRALIEVDTAAATMRAHASMVSTRVLRVDLPPPGDRDSP